MFTDEEREKINEAVFRRVSERHAVLEGLRIAPLKACGGFVYLATPYSKYSTGMQAAFEDACLLAGGLIESGVAVFSPIAHSHSISEEAGIDPLSHDIWLKADWPILEAASCCVVALMDGWRESYGVGKEIEAFRAAGKPIFTLNPVSGAVEVFE